jgi:hypothetical protein
MAESTPVDIPQKSTPIEPGEPVEQIAVSQLGGTFAERAAARQKLESGRKRVKADTDDVEDKAVKRASTKAKKKS